MESCLQERVVKSTIVEVSRSEKGCCNRIREILLDYIQ